MKKIKETGICRKGTATRKKLSIKQRGKRFLAMALSFLMVNSVIDYPGTVLASTAEDLHNYAITAIEDLDEDVKYQVLPYGAEESDIVFPDSLEVTAEYTTYEQVSGNTSTENTVSDNTKPKLFTILP